jgi:hypothetical protein
MLCRLSVGEMQEEDDWFDEDSSPNHVLQLMERLDACDAENRKLRSQLESQRSLLMQLQADALLSCAGTSGLPGTSGPPGAADHPMIIAAERGNVDMVKLLLQNGADVGMHGNAALLVACQGGHRDVAQALVERGADVHVDYDSPLMWAAQRGDAKMAAMLLDHGADPDALQGCAIRLATTLEHVAVVDVLLRHGCKV